MSSRLHRKRTFDLRVDRYWTALGRHILEWHWRRFKLRAADVTPREVALCFFQFLGLLWGLDCRGSSWLLADFLLGGIRLGVRGPISKLLCYLAAKSLRATTVKPVQTYSWEPYDDLLC